MSVQNISVPISDVSVPDHVPKSEVPKILMVEPTQESAIELANQIRRWGYDLAVVPDFKRALSHLKNDGVRMDLVLCDVRRAGTDELMFPFLAKSDPRNARLQLVCCSSISKKEEIIRLIKSGYSGFLVRPFKEEELRAKLAALLPLETGGIKVA